MVSSSSFTVVLGIHVYSNCNIQGNLCGIGDDTLAAGLSEKECTEKRKPPTHSDPATKNTFEAIILWCEQNN